MSEAVKSGGRVGRVTGLARISVCEAGRDALRVIPRSMAGLVKDASRCKQHDPRPGLLAVWTETRWPPLSCESSEGVTARRDRDRFLYLSRRRKRMW